VTDVAVLRARLEGDSAPLIREIAEAERRLEAMEKQFGKARITLPAPTGGADPFGPVTRSSATARDGVLALAQANARLAVAQGEPARGAEILANALRGVSVSSTQTIGAQTQLASLQNRIAKEASGATSAMDRLAGGVGALGVAAGALGIAEVGSQLIQFGAAAIQSANELEQTQAIMRQLSGSQAKYSEIVKLAEGNQRLFGGTVNSNLQPLNALLQLSNRTGAELQNLNDISQLLLASSPGKAFEDASFALSEFLSNTGAEAALSLADQFNLNKQALAELAAEGTSATERLAGLQALLAQQGVTAETLAAALGTTAATYTMTGAAVDQLKTQLGALLAEGFAPVAAGTGEAATAISAFLEELTGAQSPMAIFQQTLAATSGSYAEYRAAAENASAGTQIIADGIFSSLPVLGPFAGQLSEIAAQMGILTRGEYEAAGGTEAHTGAVQEAAAAGSFLNSEVGNYIQASRDATAATEQATATSNQQAFAQLEEAAAAQQAAQNQSLLEQAILSAASAGGSAEAAAARIAAQFNGVEAPAVINLINLHRELAVARGAAASLATKGFSAKGAAGQVVTKQLEYQRDLQFEIVQATGSTAQRLAAVNAQLAAAPRYSAQALRLEAEKARLIQTQAREAEKANKPGGRGGGGGSSAASKAAKDAQKLADQETKAAEDRAEKIAAIQERYRDQQVAAEERYQAELLDIQEEYAEKRAEAARDFSDQQVEDRLDFYKSLKGIEDQGIRQAASAEFEGFAAEAATIRDTQGADVAARFEDEAAQIAAARAKRAEELKKAAEDKDGDLQYLKDLDKMEREAEDRRLQRIREGEGSLESQEATERAAAEAKLQEDLGNAAVTAAGAAEEAQAKLGEQARLTADEYQRQLDLLRQMPGGAVPPVGGVPVAAAAPTGATTETPAAGGPATVSAPVISAPNVESALAQANNLLSGIRDALRSRPPYGPGA
jgi:hypothetical protein